MDATELDGSLAELTRRDLIRVRETPDAHAFGHALIRDQAYASMPKLLRADLHERFATWLEDWAGDRAVEYDEIVGHHLASAYELLLGIPPARRSGAWVGSPSRGTTGPRGEEGVGRGDVSSAAKLLDHVSILLPRERPILVETLRLAGAALRDTGGVERSLSVLDEAVEFAVELHDPSAEWLAICERFDTLQVMGSGGLGGDARSLTERRIPQLEASADHFGLAKAYGSLPSSTGTSCASPTASERAARVLNMLTSPRTKRKPPRLRPAWRWSTSTVRGRFPRGWPAERIFCGS